jgi:hypothetical protein
MVAVINQANAIGAQPAISSIIVVPARDDAFG